MFVQYMYIEQHTHRAAEKNRVSSLIDLRLHTGTVSQRGIIQYSIACCSKLVQEERKIIAQSLQSITKALVSGQF